MAINTTTLTSAVSVTDTVIAVTSATGFAVGNIVRLDGETMQVTKAYVAASLSVPVLRGVDGTVTAAHKNAANVSVELGSDLSGPPAQLSVQWPNVRTRITASYSAAGAITLPTPGTDVVAILNGTTILAMTLANPTKDQDGDMLTIVSNGKAAHTITPTTPIGNAGAGYNKFTLAAGGQNAVTLIAANGIWVTSLIAGTATNISATISA
jgi:hypothetical protein